MCVARTPPMQSNLTNVLGLLPTMNQCYSATQFEVNLLIYKTSKFAALHQLAKNKQHQTAVFGNIYNSRDIVHHACTKGRGAGSQAHSSVLLGGGHETECDVLLAHETVLPAHETACAPFMCLKCINTIVFHTIQ